MIQRPEQPAPLSRRGPRPLLLHLSLAWMKSAASAGESPNWNSVWQHSNDPADTAAITAAFAAAVQQDRALVAGIAAYRRSAYTRTLNDPPALWQEGETRLLDYGGSGPVILFVPSLVNRAYILDLMLDASMMRWLAAHSCHPLLLDWGWPGEIERHFTLTDYIAGRLERAILAAPGPVILAGYCMGGLLAMAASLRLPAQVRALALLATPWDFHAENPAQAQKLSETIGLMEPLMKLSGTLPIDALQTLFTMIDPHGVGEKYRDFAAQDQTSARAQRFVAMEDWLADGVPLAAPTARETLGGWYGGNTPARSTWRVAGLAVDPSAFKGPVFCAIPARDRLVPPASARPLAAAFDNPVIVEPAAGHIGMIAGTHAQAALWEPFTAWVQSL